MELRPIYQQKFIGAAIVMLTDQMTEVDKELI
jgi:hypothetical protein